MVALEGIGAPSYSSFMETGAHMTLLTQVMGTFRARVLAARLVSEGIDARLSGSLDTPYGFTVGDMARIEVFVPEDQLEDARYVLLADEVDSALVAPNEWWDAGVGRTTHARRWPRWVALVLLLVAVVAPILVEASRW